MKYFYENDIVKEGWANYAQLNRCSAQPINVRFCRDCPHFEFDGIQPYKEFRRGHCLRLSFESDDPKYTSHYVRVTTNDFCNEDSIHDDDC